MRISDWSSDVCSSDLALASVLAVTLGFSAYGVAQAGMSAVTAAGLGDPTPPEERVVAPQAELADRKSVVSGKSVSGRVDIGGRLIIKKNNRHNRQDCSALSYDRIKDICIPQRT